MPGIGVLVAWLLAASAAHAQLVGGQWHAPRQVDGQAPGERLGSSVCGLGDVDGDGYGDFVVGSPGASPGGLTGAGTALVFSGATGQTLHRFDGPAPFASLGASVASAGDIDGDGADDLLIGAPQAAPGGLFRAGSAYLYSGATGALIRQFDGTAGGQYLGRSVAGAGDLDADGIPDLLVGAPQASPGGLSLAGTVLVYSGASGLPIRQFDGQSSLMFLGFSVSSAGDADGDAIPDVVAGAPKTGGLLEPGAAILYSGATGLVIRQHDGTAAQRLGTSVASAGDIDLDGRSDVAVGAPGAGQSGVVTVYSGATGLVLRSMQGSFADEEFGGSVADAGDVDGDHVPDLVIGAPLTYAGSPGAGAAYVVSGATGAPLLRLTGQGLMMKFGSSVGAAGDIDGDGLKDVIVGAENDNPGGLTGAGSAVVLSIDPYLHVDAATVSASGTGSVQLRLRFPPSEAGRTYMVLASLSGPGPSTVAGLQIPLTRDGLFNRIAIGNAPAALVGAYGTLDVNSEALASLQAGQALSPAIGRSVIFAAVTYDSGPAVGRVSSIARSIAVLP